MGCANSKSNKSNDNNGKQDPHANKQASSKILIKKK